MLLTTREAVYVVQKAGDAPEAALEGLGVQRAAEGRTLSAVALDDGRVALLEGGGKIRFLDPDLPEGERVTAIHLLGEDPVEMLLGTEPAHVYRLTENGPAEASGAFDVLHVRSGWHTPWGGPPAVRTLVGTAEGWVYADIHVGSIMASPDRGHTWSPVTSDLDADVHQAATCPAAPDRLYANTARAVFLSQDHGSSWDARGRGLGNRYGRAIAVHPEQPNEFLATVSDGPNGDDVHGQLYRTADGGKSWEQVRDGFPGSTPANIDTGHVAVTADGTGWAAVGRDLYAGPVTEGAWRRVWKAPGPIGMLSVAT